MKETTGKQLQVPGDWAIAIEKVLVRQSSVLEDLAQWSTRQGDCISRGHVDDLLAVLGHRQALVEQLLASQSEFAGLADQLEDRLDAVPQGTRDRLRGRMREVDDALQRVLDRDEQDRAELERQRDVAHKELQSLDSASRARSQYIATEPQAASRRFADERG